MHWSCCGKREDEDGCIDLCDLCESPWGSGTGSLSWKHFIILIIICKIRSLGGLWAPTLSSKPFGPLDFILHSPSGCSGCAIMIGEYRGGWPQIDPIWAFWKPRWLHFGQSWVLTLARSLTHYWWKTRKNRYKCIFLIMLDWRQSEAVATVCQH